MFNSRLPQTKTCSDECHRKRISRRYGRYSDKSVSSGTAGAISEIVVSASLLKDGWDVYRAVSPSSKCDLVAIKDGIIRRVEVKTGYRYVEMGRILTPSSDHNEYDVLAAYIRLEDRIFYRDNNGTEWRDSL